MLLSREAILDANDLETDTVPVPEWGGEVLVKALSGEERDAFESSLLIKVPVVGKPGEFTMEQESSNLHAKFVARVIVDEAGNRIFNDSDIAALGRKSAAALHRVYDRAAEMSGLTATAQEEAEGNSDAAPSGDSTSD